MVKHNSDLTSHAVHRMKQRKIPASLVAETIRRGKRTILADRKAYEYTQKNILNLRGVNLKVIQGFDGVVITSYIEKVPRKYR